MRITQTHAVYTPGDDPAVYAEKKYRDPRYPVCLLDDAVPAIAKDPGLLAYCRYCCAQGDYGSTEERKTCLDAVRCWNLSNWIAERYRNLS